jgi:hypothetical protein
VWALTCLIRPTVALFPMFLFIYVYLLKRYDSVKIIKLAAAMAGSFIVIMSPWWVRNYIEIGDFIPLAASSGNPMLQGTYIDYRQTPENTFVYKLGRNAYENDKIEVEVAKKRMLEGFKSDFWGYLKWYTIGKTRNFWRGAFYWKEFLGIETNAVVFYHRLILLGFLGILIKLFNNYKKALLPVMILVYFNLVHCAYMAFDRYAYPLMPIVTMFFAYFTYSFYKAGRILLTKNYLLSEK